MIAVIGLDLSLTSTGVCDAMGNPHTIAGANGDGRLVNVGLYIEGLCTIDTPNLAVIEDLPRGAMGGSSTGMVQGIVRFLLRRADVPYTLVPPASLKTYATGKGTASKVEMALAAYKRAGVEFSSDDECDAWWLRAMGLDALGEPLFELPVGHRKALSKVTWPVPR